jgi:hypothetical protein
MGFSADLNHFPSDYSDARRRFLEFSGSAPAERGKWRIPSAKDSDLYVDHVYFPATDVPEKLFVIVSGIHGLEAYAGHAIQAMFFKEFLPKLALRDTGFLVVHCMNPYGFKYHRRCTENEVNLNRNSSLTAELFKNQNPESLRLSDLFVPKAPVDSRQSRLIGQMRREGKSVRFGEVSLDAFTKAVSAGQFSSESGLEFGGFGPEPQTRALGERLREILPKYRDIVLLDLHTGLGERGRLHLLGDGDPKSIDQSLFAELFDREKDQGVYEYTPSDAEGFYPTFGALNGLFPELAGENQRVLALTMEFATMGHDLDAQLAGLNRWMLEHQGAHYGYASPELEAQVKAEYLDRFYPNDSAWKSNVLKLSGELFSRVFSRAGILFK